mmetsp:Transcript_21032/g.39476  ORF Transcript_21032/g.39476 Transcript_21032/m.39476 type:complete len:386 (-) Transcript_21032:66-1223(-)
MAHGMCVCPGGEDSIYLSKVVKPSHSAATDTYLWVSSLMRLLGAAGLVDVVEHGDVEALLHGQVADFLHDGVVAGLLAREDPEPGAIDAGSGPAAVCSRDGRLPAGDQRPPLLIVERNHPVRASGERRQEARGHLELRGVVLVGDRGADAGLVLRGLVRLERLVVDADGVAEEPAAPLRVHGRHAVVLRGGQVRGRLLLLDVPLLGDVLVEVEVLLHLHLLALARASHRGRLYDTLGLVVLRAGVEVLGVLEVAVGNGAAVLAPAVQVVQVAVVGTVIDDGRDLGFGASLNLATGTLLVQGPLLQVSVLLVAGHALGREDSRGRAAAGERVDAAVMRIHPGVFTVNSGNHFRGYLLTRVRGEGRGEAALGMDEGLRSGAARGREG